VAALQRRLPRPLIYLAAIAAATSILVCIAWPPGSSACTSSQTSAIPISEEAMKKYTWSLASPPTPVRIFAANLMPISNCRHGFWEHRLLVGFG